MYFLIYIVRSGVNSDKGDNYSDISLTLLTGRCHTGYI